MNPKTLACILAYYPPDNFTDICNVISKQVNFLLVVENSAHKSFQAGAGTLPLNASIIYNENKGAVAGALNIALNYARNNGYTYLQIFDQDTKPPEGLTERLKNKLEKNKDVALISPRFINLNTGHPGRVLVSVSKWKVKNTWPNQDIGLVDVLFTINSTSLINIDLIPNDVFYDERLIIDGCDVDFCLELKKRGYRILVDTGYCITHGIGNRKDAGGRWSPTNYSAHRKHLMAKNRIMVWRRYFSYCPGFIFNDLLVFILDSARTVFLEKQGLKKLVAILRGIIDGFKERQIAKRTVNNQAHN